MSKRLSIRMALIKKLNSAMAKSKCNRYFKELVTDAVSIPASQLEPGPSSLPIPNTPYSFGVIGSPGTSPNQVGGKYVNKSLVSRPPGQRSVPRQWLSLPPSVTERKGDDPGLGVISQREARPTGPCHLAFPTSLREETGSLGQRGKMATFC